MQVILAVVALLAVLVVTACMACSTRPDPKMDLLLRLMGDSDNASSGAKDGIGK